ncbi:nucleotidyltransferase family protein [Lacimicrobium sp. SS2-24]|uniref:nucleotidyltransferase domain-containing protein n=1 Tax=Lacimicrobium sp. SS2-24 TaxID=2005569 RepID=UPI000B4A76C0|nr:nucleotidyltransferase family protein [Lacimicrobium sp. SS2-24]
MNLLTSTLKKPALIESFDTRDWQTLISQSRMANLIGRLAYCLLESEYHHSIPAFAKWQLQSAQKVAMRQVQQARYELSSLAPLLNQRSQRWMLLKGAAYIARDLDVAKGRSFSDIDILVDKASIKRVEFSLLGAGWQRTQIDDYDDRYYRQWMHEIPPLKHSENRTVLDIHHNILPLTNRDCPEPEQFETQEVDVENVGTLLTLTAEDLIIHSACHLFTESEFHNGLRDLSDLDMLFRHFSNKAPDFMQRVLTRASVLGLRRYLDLALYFCKDLFDTPVQTQIAPPNTITGFAFKHIFTPDHRSARTWKRHLAVFILYWRGHMLRMPLRLLIPHLLRKSLTRLQQEKTA